LSQKSLNDGERGGNCLLVPEHSYGPGIDVKNVFYVFYSEHVFTFLTFFILPTFFIFKNVHWKYHLKSLSKHLYF